MFYYYINTSEKMTTAMMDDFNYRDHIERLFIDLWQNGEVEKVLDYYTEDVVVNYRGKEYGLDELKRRVDYSKERYHNKCVVLRAVHGLSDTLFAVHTEQTGIDTKDAAPFLLNVFIAMSYYEHRVNKVWVMSSRTFNYAIDIKDDNYIDDENERFSFQEMELDFFLDFVERRRDQFPFNQLKDNHIRCLFYYLKGLSAKESGKILGLSNRTIEVYLLEIRQLYQVSSRYELGRKLYQSME